MKIKNIANHHLDNQPFPKRLGSLINFPKCRRGAVLISPILLLFCLASGGGGTQGRGGTLANPKVSVCEGWGTLGNNREDSPPGTLKNPILFVLKGSGRGELHGNLRGPPKATVTPKK